VTRWACDLDNKAHGLYRIFGQSVHEERLIDMHLHFLIEKMNETSMNKSRRRENISLVLVMQHIVNISLLYMWPKALSHSSCWRTIIISQLFHTARDTFLQIVHCIRYITWIHSLRLRIASRMFFCFNYVSIFCRIKRYWFVLCLSKASFLNYISLNSTSPSVCTIFARLQKHKD